jgi:8-oxo-dGTP diphosphatase
LEDGESLQACLERELLEELAMRATVADELARTIYHYEHGSFEMVALRTERLSDFALNVHDRVIWATSGDIAGLQLAPADVDLIDQILTLGHWR